MPAGVPARGIALCSNKTVALNLFQGDRGLSAWVRTGRWQVLQAGVPFAGVNKKLMA